MSRTPNLNIAAHTLIKAPQSIGLLVKRIFRWHLDLVSASYYASEVHYSEINPESTIVVHTVIKTRGGQQYYQSSKTMSWELSYSDVICGKRIMPNPSHALCEIEAKGRNQVLSVQRKSYAGGVLLLVGIFLEIAGIDISILT